MHFYEKLSFQTAKSLPSLDKIQQNSTTSICRKSHGTPPHRLVNTIQWLNQQNIYTMDWPACSPDLKRLYVENRVFKNSFEFLNNLNLNMPRSIVQVINRNVDATNY